MRSWFFRTITTVPNIGSDPSTRRPNRVTIRTKPAPRRPPLIGCAQAVVFDLHVADSSAICTVGDHAEPRVVVPVGLQATTSAIYICKYMLLGHILCIGRMQVEVQRYRKESQ